jgi:hypothetical protein
VAIQIVIAPFEKLVFLYVQNDVEVARRAALPARVTFSGNPEFRSIVHARGDFDFEGLFSNDTTIAVTHRAFVLDDLSGTVAVAAGPRDAEETLLEANLTVSVTCWTGRRPRTFLSATAMALSAGFVARNFDLRCCSERRFFKREFHIVAKVRAALNARATAASAAEDIAEAEEIAEDVAKIGKDTWIETTRAGGGSNARMSEPIIVHPLLCIAENGVRFSSFFECLFGLLVSRIAIRMVLECQFAIGTLDFLV